MPKILSFSKVIQVSENDCQILSPHLVVVSGGKKRVVGNFKGLNKLSVKDSFKGPSISTIVPSCSKFLFQTKVDLKLGFNNVNVDDSTKPLLCFSYDGHFFRYEVMSLGISSGPFIFDNWAREFCRVVQMFIRSKF